MTDLVSVIIPIYNGERFINECIDSVLNQSYQDVEIIVVYDESPDNSLKILEGYGDRIRIIKQGKTNPAIARNTGYLASKGDFIAFCDIDDYFALTKIEKQVECMKSAPKAGLIYTDVVMVDDDSQEVRRTVCPEWNRKYWLSHRFVVFSSVMMRRTAIEKLLEKSKNLFDESLNVCEDFDALINLSALRPFKRCPHYLSYYRFTAQSLSRSKFWEWNRVRLGIFKKYRMNYQFARSFLLDIPVGIVSEYYIAHKYIKKR